MNISGHALEYVPVGDMETLEAPGDAAILRCRRLITETEERISALTENHCNAEERISQYTVINPIPEEREELVKLHVTTPYGFNGIVLKDSTGVVLPYQVTEVFISHRWQRAGRRTVRPGHRISISALAEQVRSLGLVPLLM